MRRKLRTNFSYRFIVVLVLLLVGVGNYSYAQTYSSPSRVTTDVNGHSRDKENKSKKDSLKQHYLNIASIQVVLPDTTDSLQTSDSLSIIMGGNEGWRMVAPPLPSPSFSEMFDSLWVQGITDSDDPIHTVPSILSWNEEEQGFSEKPAAMRNSMYAGKGYIIFLFEDNDQRTQGVQGGFPKKLTVTGREMQKTVPIKVTATDINKNNHLDGHEGWNLIGNPFNTELSVEKVLSQFKAAGDSLNRHVYIWNRSKGRGNAGFKVLGGEDTIGPYQAFFIKYMGSQEVNAVVELHKDKVVEEGQDLKFKNNLQEDVFLSVRVNNGQQYDSFELVFSEEGQFQFNNSDAYKLLSLEADALNVYGIKGENRLQRSVLPKGLSSTIEIPIHIKYQQEEELEIEWENLKDLPHDWTLTLRDTKRNIEKDLRTNREYQFKHQMEERHQKIPDRTQRPHILPIEGEAIERKARFMLFIRPGKSKISTQDSPESIKLKPNFPNPFTQTTTISYELAEETEVTLSIWNMIGQKVATLVDDMVEAGTHEEHWIASQMPSGMYIARLEVGNQVFTRKMTLIK